MSPLVPPFQRFYDVTEPPRTTTTTGHHHRPNVRHRRRTRPVTWEAQTPRPQAPSFVDIEGGRPNDSLTSHIEMVYSHKDGRPKPTGSPLSPCQLCGWSIFGSAFQISSGSPIETPLTRGSTAKNDLNKNT